MICMARREELIKDLQTLIVHGNGSFQASFFKLDTVSNLAVKIPVKVHEDI